jgi:sortase A
MRRRVATAVSTLLVVLGAVETARGLWIPAKAQLAQILMHRAWIRAQAGEAESKPWPWADTWPVARLRLPEHGADLIVLAGASGATMAFAPGHLDGSDAPGGDGVCVLSGHRDTHFAVLEAVEPGDRVLVEDSFGDVHEYVVQAAAVVHENDTASLGRAGPGSLVLVTCWPFGGIGGVGEERFVVWAVAVSDQRSASSRGCRPRTRIRSSAES